MPAKEMPYGQRVKKIVDKLIPWLLEGKSRESFYRQHVRGTAIGIRRQEYLRISREVEAAIKAARSLREVGGSFVLPRSEMPVFPFRIHEPFVNVYVRYGALVETESGETVWEFRDAVFSRAVSAQEYIERGEELFARMSPAVLGEVRSVMPVAIWRVE